MAKKIIRTGTTADPIGDSLKNAFVKVNDNFTELYNALGLDNGGLNIGAFEFAGSVISTTDSTPIVIDQSATITSNLSVGGDILPQTANGGDLGSSTLPWRSLYVSTNTIYLGGVPLTVDASNNLTVNGSRVGATSYADLSGKPALTTVATTGAYADLTGKPTIPTLVSQLSNDSGFLTSVGNISNIQSEGNINIDINLSDSTLRRWQFGEDGELTFPDGYLKIVPNGANPYISNRTDNGLGLVSGSAIQIRQSTADAYGITIDSSTTNTAGTSTLAIGSSIDVNGSKIVLGKYTYTSDVGSNLTSQNKIEINNDAILIGPYSSNTVDGSTVTAFTGWTFGTGGLLSLGASVGGIHANQTTGVITIGDNIAPNGAPYAPSTVIQVGGATNAFLISAYGPPARSWTFGMDGALTVPGDIKSSGNINIDINLSDSTLRRWSFGEDGDLNVAGPIILPNNSELRPSSTAYDAALATWELNIAQFVRDRISLELVTEAGWPMATWYPTGTTAQGYIDFLLNAWTIQNTGGATLIIQPPMSTQFYNDIRAALIAIRDSYNASTKSVSLSSAYGKSWNFSETGDLTIPGSIRSDTGLYIDVNLVDSTLHRWQFGEDGALTLPSVGKINNGAYDWTFGSTGNTTFPTGLTLGAPRGVDTVNFTAAVDKEFQIETGTATSSKLWQFGTDGSLTIPGDIKSNGNINIDINLSDSTLRRWQFGEDGSLNIPGGIVFNGSTTANISGSNNDGTYQVSYSAGEHWFQGAINRGNFVWIDTLADLDGVGTAGHIRTGSGQNLIIDSGYDGGAGANSNLYLRGRQIEIRANVGGNGIQSKNWIFTDDGALQFPDATVQTTAYTGSVAAGTLTGTALASGVVSSSLTSVGTLGTLAVTGSVTAETFNTDQITVVGNRISTTVTNANLELECNGTGGVVINTVADATTSSTVKSVGYLGLPQSATATTATLAIGDAGKHIYITTTGQTITIPAASSVAYPIGTTLTFIAGPSATTVTIAITSDTLRLAGGTSTGSRTLAANGMATAVKVSGTSSAGVWYINGTGLT